MSNETHPSDEDNIVLELTRKETTALDRLLQLCFSIILADRDAKPPPPLVVFPKEDELDVLWRIWRKLQTRLVEKQGVESHAQ